MNVNMIHHLVNPTNITILTTMTILYMFKLVCSERLSFFIAPSFFLYFAGVGIFLHFSSAIPLEEGTLLSRPTLDNIIFVALASFIFHLAASFNEALLINKRNQLNIEDLKEKDSLQIKVSKLESDILYLVEHVNSHRNNINHLHTNLQKLSDRTADMITKLYENHYKK